MRNVKLMIIYTAELKRFLESKNICYSAWLGFHASGHIMDNVQ